MKNKFCALFHGNEVHIIEIFQQLQIQSCDWTG